MTREEARKVAKILKAYSEGETIEHYDGKNWGQQNELDFSDSPENYRIKTDLKKYRPFKSVKEMWQEVEKHKPFAKIYLLDEDDYAFIGPVYKKCNFGEVMKKVTFADGTPFGIKI